MFVDKSRLLAFLLITFPLTLGVACQSKSASGQDGAASALVGRAALSAKTDKVWVVAHRGDWRMHPENSLGAIQGAIAMGVDVVEVDIQLTKDKVPVLMHDEKVDRTTNGAGNVADMTLSQIRSLYLKERQGGNEPLTKEQVPTLEEALELAKGKAMINLDKGWEHRNEVWDVLVKTGSIEYAIFKSASNNFEVENWLRDKSPRPAYVQVMTDNHLHLLDALLKGAKPDAYELVFSSYKAKVVSDETLAKIRASGAKLWVNSMLPTQIAGMKDTETAWEWSIGKGARFIQTDAPARLLRYLKKE